MDESWLHESLHISLLDLSQTIQEVESLLDTHQTSNPHNEDPLTTEAGENILVENHASILNNTHLVVQELQQITMACIKQGESGLEVPSLDPMLQEWILACEENMRRIKMCLRPLEKMENVESVEKVETETEESEDESWTLVENREADVLDSVDQHDELHSKTNHNVELAQDIPATNSNLRAEFTSLQDRTTHIAEFIPILKTQINESLFTNISPTPPPQSNIPNTFQTPLGQSNYTTPDSSTPLSSLRKLLYELADSLKECRQHLTSLCTSHSVSVDMQTAITSLLATSETSISTLSILLSNNATEWINSAFCKKLSFSEFKNLDQDELQEFVDDLKELNGTLVQAVRHGIANDGEEAGYGTVDLKVEGVEILEQRIGGLNWMLGVRELD